MNNLLEIRKQRGFVLMELSVKAGVSTATLNAIEKYGATPVMETQYRIAAALNVEASDIWPVIEPEATGEKSCR